MSDEQKRALQEISDIGQIQERNENWRGLDDFIRESNKIESEATDDARMKREHPAYWEFLNLPAVTVEALETLVSIVKPGNVLRFQRGMDVRVGNHVAPEGGPGILDALRDLLDRIGRRELPAYYAHHEYETLHPFTDGNGRSGRALWLWMHRNQTRGGAWERAIHLGFLHAWYYETLHFGRGDWRL